MDPISTINYPLSSSVSAAGKELAGLDMARGGKPNTDQVVEQFQEILLGEMMKAMRATVPDSGLLEGGEFEQDTFRSLLDQEFVQTAGHQMGGLGLGDALKRQLGLGETIKAEIKKRQ